MVHDETQQKCYFEPLSLCLYFALYISLWLCPLTNHRRTLSFLLLES